MGIMETVTADLKAVEGLSVIGCERICEVEKRLTGRAAHGEIELATRLGREVGARRVVTGGYQRLGDVARITARVTDVDTGVVLPTVKVDGAMADLFSLQDRIVKELSAGLQLAAHAREDGEETHVLDAYEAFSKGLVNLRAESRESVDRAILFFERAVALDPAYARAWLELGEAYGLKATYLAVPELLDRAVAALEKCLALQPRLARAWRELGATLVDMGLEDRGFESIRRALEIAIGAFEDRLRLGADEPFTRYYVAGAWALRGEKERALDVLERAVAMRRAYTVARARIEPDFESLRSEPRFIRFLEGSQTTP